MTYLLTHVFIMAFIQWNIRGLQANRQELSLLLSDTNADLVCLQETFLPDNTNTSFKTYSFYGKNSNSNNSSVTRGGVAILVKQTVPHKLIQLQTNLQAVAVRATCNKTLTVCSIYLSPSHTYDATELADLIDQLPPPVLLLGDFNAHSTLWGGRNTDTRGKVIEDIMLKYNLSLLNNGSTTYLHPATGSLSAIDLSICDPGLYLDYEWSVHDDLCGSDHFPIVIKTNEPTCTTSNPTWKLNKADWCRFSDMCSAELGCEGEDLSMEDFTTTLNGIAENCIPKSKGKSRKHNTVWHNDDCRQARKDRNRILKKLKVCPSARNLEAYRISRAKTRRVLRSTQQNSWRSFVSKLNSRTSLKKVWKMVHKITGKKQSDDIHFLSANGNELSTVPEIVDGLGQNFSQNSSSHNYSNTFQAHRLHSEHSIQNFHSANSEIYNTLFSIDELKDSISKSHDTATGPDNIHYQMLKHLPPDALMKLLDILNDIWQTGNFPPGWRLATVIPVPKPGKDRSDPSSYRPIALTSCICKIMERMVNNRLIWYLDINSIITAHQSGFRKGRSTNDQLIRLETFIREAFISRQHAVGIFFDLEKAYDTTWKYGILKDLHDAGLRGRLPAFVDAFLKDRKFQVRMSSTFSGIFDQEMGVPQGCILSVTLFALKINSIVKALCPGVECSLYVDDFLICYRSKYIHIIERHLQRCLNKLQEWADTNGFKFSESKTVCVHFCRLRKCCSDPSVILNGKQIPVVQETKFLGLIFDNKLSFIPHLKYLRTKCLKALNLLRVVSHTHWGADQETLLHLYRSLIRSKLDYGCIVYGSARDSYLKILDPIQNHALRLCLGAFRTSPATSLCVEANEPPLSLRRRKLSSQYILRLGGCRTNPTYDCVFNLKSKRQFLNKPTQIAPLGMRMAKDLHKIGFKTKNCILHTTSSVAPWLLCRPRINLDLHIFNKNNLPPEALRSLFAFIKCDLGDHVEIYTDGSKVGEAVGCAAVCGSSVKDIRLPKQCNIFTAELYAIRQALDIIRRSNKSSFVVYSDSLSSLQAIQHFQIDNEIILDILKVYTQLVHSCKRIVLCWVPSHVGITGNEKADTAAKASLTLSAPTDFKIPGKNFYSYANSLYIKEWQQSWDNELNNKLHSINPTVGKFHKLRHLSRREQTVITRLRIGHTRLTHSYLMSRDSRPECAACKCPLTVKHLLLECPYFSNIRRKHFTCSSMKELFEDVNPRHIIDFIKEINFYHCI